MLVRLVTAIKESVERKRLCRLLRGKDASIENLSGKQLTWKTICQVHCDLLAVSRSLIPEPFGKHIASITEGDNAPALLILTDREDLEEQAHFRAAGALLNLNLHLPDPVFAEMLETSLAERIAYLNKAMVAKRAVPRPHLSDFVSSSPAMKAFMKTVHQVMDSDVPLLILGETGVGKERLARAIHGAGKRAEAPFITLNCGAIPENLIESELFGHREGAFTGATRDRRGCFELAHRGTLFLDEIGEMPQHLQVKLLRVLEDMEVKPVGCERPLHVDVRVMTATNRNIIQEVADKQFRLDLYYRLSVIKLEIPPLRERREDIPTLTRSFVEQLSARLGREIEEVSAEVLDAFNAYEWPGNVRELINVLERAILISDTREIRLDNLPDEFRMLDPSRPAPRRHNASLLPTDWRDKTLKQVRRSIADCCEKEYLTRMLEDTRGRISETARRAGIQPRSLFGKMQKHALRKEDFKD